MTQVLDESKGTDIEAMIVRNIGKLGKPFTSSQEIPARMDIVITWKNEAHGDSENVFGSIADALFKQDKYLAGSFDWRPACGAGSVEVMITLQDKR